MPASDKQVLINGMGYLSGYTGYNIHSRNFFKALAKLYDLVTLDLRYFPDNESDHVNKINHFAASLEILNIMINYGSAMGLLGAYPGLKIGYTVWESTKIPDDWLAPLKGTARIWIPSHWGKEVLVANGFDRDKIDVVPEGVDPGLFNPNREKIAKLTDHPAYKFLFLGKYEERKFTKELVIAFDEEFKDDEDAVLILACFNPFVEGFDIRQIVNNMGLSRPDKIYYFAPTERHEDIARLYVSCDAFVFPTRAEGWGLPIIEAMACGLPTIVTDHSGQSEFVNENNAYLLKYSLEPITEPFFLSASGDYGLWARPDIEHLKSLMRKIFEEQAGAKEFGLKASRDILRNWTWAKAAEKASKHIERLIR